MPERSRIAQVPTEDVVPGSREAWLRSRISDALAAPDAEVPAEVRERWARECAAILESSAAYRATRLLTDCIAYAHPELVR